MKKSQLIPQELATEILARLPLSRHVMAKQVLKSFNESFLRGDVFVARSKAGIKETCLFVNIRSSTDTEWYKLEEKVSKKEYILRHVNLPSFPEKPKIVSAGHRIFFFSGVTTAVLAVNCGLNTNATYNMKSVHKDPEIAVVADKLYVFGGCSQDDENYLEAFDLTKNTWTTISIPQDDRSLIPLNCHVVVLRDHVQFIHKHNCVVFDPKYAKLERKDHLSFGDIMYQTSCITANGFYALDSESRITVYNVLTRKWILLNGIENIPEVSVLSSALLGFNGKLLLLHQTSKKILVTVIALEKRGLEIWGSIESSHSCLTFEKPAHINEFVSVEI